MITLENAIEIVRKKYTGWLIRTVFTYNDDYHFSISNGRKFIVDNPACLLVVVNHVTGDIDYRSVGDLLFGFKTKQESLEYKEASSNMKPVDITAEQFEELMSIATI